MERKSQVFKCGEIWKYDRQIHEESHAKIQEWIERFSDIKPGDVVSHQWEDKRVKVLSVQLCRSRVGDDMSFYYIVAPVNKKGDLIPNRKEHILESVVKDGVLYENPSYIRSVYSAAQLRFDDYFYMHRRESLRPQ